MQHSLPENQHGPDHEHGRFDATVAVWTPRVGNWGDSQELSSSSQGRSANRILVPTDFTPNDLKAAQHAVALAQKLGARITLLHVIDINDPAWLKFAGSSDEFMRQLRNKAHSEMENLLKSLAGESIELESLIAEGIPWKEIADRTPDFDLVIVSRPRSQPFWKLFSKKTAQRVIDRAQSGVWVIQE
jgi:nucleotide-binding universal stress UspA family protein